MNRRNVALAALAVASAAVLAAALQSADWNWPVPQDAGDQETDSALCGADTCVVQGIPNGDHNGTHGADSRWPNVHANVLTRFNAQVETPSIESSAFIHPFAVVIGNCHIGRMVFVAPTAVCRGDEGTPIHIGDGSNMQDGVVIHALETVDDGHNIDNRRFSADGDRLRGDDPAFDDGYAVFVGNNTSLAHGAMVHGPAWIGSSTFIGMEALVFNAKIGSNVAVGVSATITGGVLIADGRFVPPGAVISTQEQADSLPERAGSAYEATNAAVVNVNQQLAGGYDLLDLERLAIEREKEMEERMLETSMPHP